MLEFSRSALLLGACVPAEATQHCHGQKHDWPRVSKKDDILGEGDAADLDDRTVNELLVDAGETQVSLHTVRRHTHTPPLASLFFFFGVAFNPLFTEFYHVHQ